MKPTPYKHMDHLVDCLRYIVMARPQAAEVPEKIVTVNYDNRTHERALRQLIQRDELAELEALKEFYANG